MKIPIDFIECVNHSEIFNTVLSNINNEINILTQSNPPLPHLEVVLFILPSAALYFTFLIQLVSQPIDVTSLIHLQANCKCQSH